MLTQQLIASRSEDDGQIADMSFNDETLNNEDLSKIIFHNVQFSKCRFTRCDFSQSRFLSVTIKNCFPTVISVKAFGNKSLSPTAAATAPISRKAAARN